GVHPARPPRARARGGGVTSAGAPAPHPGGPVLSWPFAVGSPPVWPGCLRHPRLGARCVSGSVAAPLVLGGADRSHTSPVPLAGLSSPAWWSGTVVGVSVGSVMVFSATAAGWQRDSG